MPRKVKAKIGDSLCNIAFLNGFGDCKPLRDEPANAFIVNRVDDPGQVLPGDIVTVPDFIPHSESKATEKKHKFVKRDNFAILRFVHGSKDTPVKNDRTLTFLNVSNYVTNLAGVADGEAAKPLPSSAVRDFNEDADKDIDAFKIEVLDIDATADLDVELEVLRPVYDAAGKVTKHTRFPAAIRGPRLLTPKASKQGTTQRFRTCYLRLVVDDVDKAAANDQTLLASDMFAPNDADAQRVEILDQTVKASYTITKCPQNPKCKSTVILPIGRDRRRIRLAVHVLRDKPKKEGGTPIVPIDDVKKRILTWFRRVYAQMNIAPKLIMIQEIDPPANLVSISNDGGEVALGTESLGFRIKADGANEKTIGPITPKAGDRPGVTAQALAKLIKAPYKAAVSENSARLNSASDNNKSFDIVITEESGARVTIDQPVGAGVTGHSLSFGRVNPASVPRAPFSFSGLIGTLEQRALFKNFDTKFKAADDTVDVFVVNNILPAAVLGTATISGHRVNAARRTTTKVRCSVLITVRSVDSSNTFPFVFPHEFGHVAGEAGHAQAALQQLMTQFTSQTNAVDGPKRVRDAPVTYDLVPGTYNLIDRIRRENGVLLENW